VRACCVAETGSVNCDFSDINICGYRDESEGDVGWTRYYFDGHFHLFYI